MIVVKLMNFGVMEIGLIVMLGVGIGVLDRESMNWFFVCRLYNLVVLV